MTTSLTRLICAALLLLCFSCSEKQPEIDGFWYGQHEGNYPITYTLVHIDNDLFIEHSGWIDSNRIALFGDSARIYHPEIYPEGARYRLDLQETVMRFYRDSADTPFRTLYRQRGAHAFEDLLSDKSLQVRIPAVTAYPATIGREISIRYPMYIGRKGGQLAVHFNDSTHALDSTFFRVIFRELMQNPETHQPSVTLVGDRELMYRDLRLLLDQLRIAGLYRLTYATLPASQHGYNQSHFIRGALLPASERLIAQYGSAAIVPSPPHSPDSLMDALLVAHGVPLSLVNGQLVYGTKVLDQTALQLLIDTALRQDPKAILALHLPDATSYPTYLRTQHSLREAYHALRNEAALDSFGISFDGLSEQRSWGSQEAKNNRKAIIKRVPYRVATLDTLLVRPE